MNHNEISREALAIREEVIQKFPEHTTLLRNVMIRVSNRTTLSVGICNFKGGKPFEIVLSGTAFQHEANRTEFRDTVLHEIAHAIAGLRAGHGPEWKRIAIMVGAKPENACSLAVSPIKYVEVACHVCKQPLKLTSRKAAMHRNGTATYRHRACRPTNPLSLLNTIFS